MALASSPRPKMRPDNLDTTPSSGRSRSQSRETSTPQAREASNSGGKGGGRPQIASNQVSNSAYNNDKSYGYYNDQGRYVSALQDMFDGGGMNQSGNYFQGGGAISAMLNAAKVRPAGAARARDDQGNYIVDRSDIGFRDINDWFDRGGPQASGGEFQGLGLYSALANLVAGQKGNRTPYAAPNQNLLQTAPRTTNSAPPNQITTPPLRGPAGSTTTINVPPLSGPAGAPVPQTGLLNQYQEQYENIPMASQTIGMPEVAPTNVTTFDDFMKMQKEMEQQYGLSSMTPDEYMSVYQRFLKRTQASSY